MVTLVNRSLSGLQGRFGVKTASKVENPSLLLESAWQKAAPAGPDLLPMIRSTWAISFPSPTKDSPMKKSAAIAASVVGLKRCAKKSRSMAEPGRNQWEDAGAATSRLSGQTSQSRRGG